MKRIVAAILVVLMVVPILFSCSKKGKETAPTDMNATDLTDSSLESTDKAEERPVEKYSNMEFLSYKLNDEQLTLTVKISSNEYEAFKISSKHNGKQEQSVDVALSNGNKKYDFVFEAVDKSNNTFDFKLQTEGGAICQEASVVFKNHLPQLTKDGVWLVVSAMTDEEKASLVVGDYDNTNGYTGATTPIPRLGVPQITLNDGPAGVRKGSEPTWLPSATILASSWDLGLVDSIGYAVGEECILEGVDILLTPGMNIQRSVLNGRNFEYYSEDPMLTGYIAAALVNSIQDTGVGVSLKHYAVNNQETGRTTVSAELTERALREIYLRGFGYAIEDSRPYTVMSSYNRVNGTYTSINADLLSILRDEFGFDGFVMSDWGANGASPLMINAGNDIAMPGDASRYNDIINAIDNYSINFDALDIAVANILSVIVKTNTFNGSPIEPSDYDDHIDAVRKGAEGGIILLKNDDGALPVIGEVALFGQGSYTTLYGGSGSGFMNSSGCVSISDGISFHKKFTLNSAAKEKYSSANTEAVFNASELSDIASTSSVGIVTIQRNTAEGHDHAVAKGDWYLSDKELKLLTDVSKAFHDKGKDVVVLLNCGNPIETESWIDLVDAVLYVGYSGQETGSAVANILCGDVNPSGKTAVTWPSSYSSTPSANNFGLAQFTEYYEDIYVGYRYHSTFDVGVSFPFGYGLSYTTFEYSDFAVSKSSFKGAYDTVELSVTVKNTGNVEGREVVQFYVSKPDGVNEQAKYDLCGFGKTKLLKPNESERITFTVTADELKTYIESKSDWVIEKGSYIFSVASSVEAIQGSASATVDSDILVQDVTNKCVNTSNINVLTKADKENVGKEAQNLLAGATATASDNEGGAYPAENAIDGIIATRWSAYDSSKGDRILTIDLGAEYEIGKISTMWESNSASAYLLKASRDGSNWVTLEDCKMKNIGIVNHSLKDVKARYIRIIVSASSICCSIYEVTVEGPIGLEQELVNVKKKNNLALTATATSNFTEGAYYPSLICDGVYSTRWSGFGNTGASNVILDLGTVSKLGSSAILWETNSAYSFSIYTSDDGKTFKLYKTFSIPGSANAQNYRSVFDLSGIETRYIRLSVPATTYISVYEWEIFEA